VEGKQFVVCIENDCYPASRSKRKIYLSPPDPEALETGMVRVIDEPGEDHLCPEELSA
jgi:hypothetical protein